MHCKCRASQSNEHSVVRTRRRKALQQVRAKSGNRWNISLSFYRFELSCKLNKGPVNKHEADAMGIIFIIQHLPRDSFLVRDRPTHAWNAQTALDAGKTLQIDNTRSYSSKIEAPILTMGLAFLLVFFFFFFFFSETPCKHINNQAYDGLSYVD